MKGLKMEFHELVKKVISAGILHEISNKTLTSAQMKLFQTKGKNLNLNTYRARRIGEYKVMKDKLAEPISARFAKREYDNLGEKIKREKQDLKIDASRGV